MATGGVPHLEVVLHRCPREDEAVMTWQVFEGFEAFGVGVLRQVALETLQNHFFSPQ